MDPKDFTSTRAGTLVMQNPGNPWAFWSYVPHDPATLTLEPNEALTSAVQRANDALARLAEALSGATEDQVHTLVGQEGLASATMSYPDLPDVGVAGFFGADSSDEFGVPSRDELEERRGVDAHNLAAAIEYMGWRSKEIALSNRLIQEVHGMALASAHNDKATPGWFRTSATWMGSEDATLQNAAFVPPAGDEFRPAMAAVERYANPEQAQNPVVEAAILHYAFETVHPFLDGNGRVGRALATQYLVAAGTLSAPVLLLSAELAARPASYYTLLADVQSTGALEAWVTFFATTLERAANKTLAKLGELQG